MCTGNLILEFLETSKYYFLFCSNRDHRCSEPKHLTLYVGFIVKVDGKSSFFVAGDPKEPGGMRPCSAGSLGFRRPLTDRRGEASFFPNPHTRCYSYYVLRRGPPMSYPSSDTCWARRSRRKQEGCARVDESGFSDEMSPHPRTMLATSRLLLQSSSALRPHHVRVLVFSQAILAHSHSFTCGQWPCQLLSIPTSYSSS